MIKYTEVEEKMKKTVDVVAREFSALRAGRATPVVLEKIKIDYYGSPTPVMQVASVSATDARTLVIQPWDKGIIKLIEKAIQTSDLGINPQNDGTVIRLAFPPLTEERRRDLIKQVNKYAEDGKVAIRNLRRDALDKYKAMQKKSEITEDDLKEAEKDIQKITDEHTKEIDKMVVAKEKELLEV